MALISKIIIYLSIIIFAFGQLLRIDFKGLSFPLIDISILAIFCLNIFQKIKDKDLKIKNKYFLYFLIFAWLSFIINFFRYQIDSISPLLYLLRLTCLISFFIFPLNLKDKNSKNFFIIAIISNLIFGLIQYFIWPNFTYFNSQNWDPHLFRLVGAFFDPTFTAFIYLMFLIYLYLNSKIPYRWLLMITAYFAMILTYSRSAYLSFLLAFTFIAFKKKNIKIFLISFVLIVSTILLLPRQEGEGTKLERTSSITAKIENYKEAFSTFKKAPIIGHGYNNLYFVRDIKIQNSHANFGFDSSLMTILTTTGIIGLLLFLLGLKNYFIRADLTHQSIIIALLLHSLFANSLLYPWILLFLIFI